MRPKREPIADFAHGDGDGLGHFYCSHCDVFWGVEHFQSDAHARLKHLLRYRDTRRTAWWQSRPGAASNVIVSLFLQGRDPTPAELSSIIRRFERESAP